MQRAGGITIVQEPDSAEAQTMPASALRLITPTHVATLPGIAALLASLRIRR